MSSFPKLRQMSVEETGAIDTQTYIRRREDIVWVFEAWRSNGIQCETRQQINKETQRYYFV